jgi:uncharacterized repeat protein (TIGR01451 family)
MVTLTGLAGVATAPTAVAFSAPSAVKDVSANSVTSGVLFGGRNEATAVNPVNHQIVLAAEEFGGLWKSTDGSAHWAHVDGLPLTAMDDVKFAASDPGLVVATGEYDGSSSNHTAQIYVSTDGGTTWSRANTTTCGGNAARSAHKIAIGTGTPGSLNIFVATDCGLVTSSDSGSTWSNVTPNGIGNQFWGMAISGTGPNFTVDACGGSGFFRSPDGGSTWSQNGAALAGGALPCRIATAPGNANVVFLASFSAAKASNGLCLGQLLESDNGGTSFTSLNPTGDGNCRPANVIAAPGFDGTANHFEVFFATDSNWLHQQCDLNNLPGTTACSVGNGSDGGAFSDYDGSIKAVHNSPDSSDLAFGTDGCPFLATGDGGLFSTTNGCTSSPTFTQANVGLHALQATGHAGTSYAGHTDAYFSTQDNGIWNTGDGGSTWQVQGPDVYGVFADQDGPPSQAIYKECCFGSPPTGKLFQNNEGLTSQSGFSGPPGNLPAFGNILGAQFGYQSYAILTSDNTPTWRVYVTTDNGGTWTEMGADLPAGSKPSQIVASGPSSSPSFYLLNAVGANAPTVSRLAGPLNGTATLTPVNNGLTSPGLIAADPSNPLLLYAEDNGGSGAMMRSVNGGASWTQDAALTNLITNGGGVSLPGFVTAIGFDPNSATVLVGTVDSGAFASTDGGGHWSLLRGSTEIERAVGFFFDEKTGKAYAASRGRAEWEIDLPHADLSITKTHTPDPVTAGTQLTSTLTVANNGPDAAPDVTVTDTLPPQLTYLTNNLNPPAGCTAAGQVVTCTLGDLASGQTASFQIVTLVNANTVVNTGGATSITNTATVQSAAVVDLNPANNTAADTVVVNDSADVGVTKLCTPDTTVYAGTPITCTVYVDNHGPSYARNVVLDDTISSNGAFTVSNQAVSPGPTTCSTTPVTGGQKLSCAVGNLAQSSTTQTGRVTLTYTLSATEGQNINDVAAARSDTPDPQPGNNQAQVNLTVSAVADLALTSSAPPSVVAGQPIAWSLQATNNGPSTATNVAITDTVPAGVAITSVTASGGACTAGVPGDSTHPTVCTFGSLAPLATLPTMTISATVNPGTTGILHNDARVSSATFDNNSANDLTHTDTTVVVQSSLSVTKTATPNAVVAGTALSYQITVGNNGPSTATAVALSDPLPGGVTFTSTGGVGTCGFQTNTNTVTCQLPNLDPGQSEVVFIYTTVKPSTPPGPMTNTATATANGSPTASGSITTTVQTRADLGVVLASDANVYKASTTIHYQVTVTNYGPSDAQQVVLTQALPSVKQGKYISNNIGCAPPSGTTLVCQSPPVAALATIPAGGSVTWQVNFYITGNKGTITSTASVTSATTDPVTSNNASTRVVTVK